MRRTIRQLYRRGLDLPVVGSILDQYSSLGLLRDRRFAVLGVSKFLDAMSTTIIVPLLPVYAENLGASAFLIGIIFAAPKVSKAVLNTPFGHLADRTNRRSWMVAGMILGAVSVILLGFVGVPLALVALRAADGVGEAMKMPATQAYIGDVTDEEERGRAFGAHRTLGMLGMAVGPVVGGVLSEVGGLALPFVVLGTGTLLGGLLLLVALPPVDEAIPDEPTAEGSTAEGDSSTDDSPFWDVSLAAVRPFLTVSIVALLLDALVSSVGTNALYAFFALLLRQNYGADAALTGVAWSAFGFALFLFMPVGGTAADRAGRKRTLILGKLGWVVVMFGLAWATTPVVAVVLLFLGGTASAFMSPALSSLVYELAPEGKEGTLNGLNGSLSSTGSALGPILGGVIVEWFGVTAVFVAIGALWVVTTLDLALFVPETRPSASVASGGTEPEASSDAGD